MQAHLQHDSDAGSREKPAAHNVHLLWNLQEGSDPIPGSVSKDGGRIASLNLPILCPYLSTCAIPLKHPRLKGFFDSLIIPANSNIQMEVAITHVAISHGVDHWETVVFAYQT